MRIKHKNHTFTLLAVIALGLFLVIVVRHGGYPSVPLARGDASSNVSGFAWSQTIGWISLNCLDSSPGGTYNDCATANYGVNVDPASGKFTGMAWSSSIGYINFDPTPDPATGCTASPCAVINVPAADGTRTVTGWVRACAVLSDPNCIGTAMKSPQVLGGWDGWIKLADASWTNPANYDYLGSSGVAYDAGGHHGIYLDTGTSKLKGFAWGGEVVGWVDFAPVVPPAAGGVFANLPPPDIAVTPIQIDFGNVELNASKSQDCFSVGVPCAFTITNTAGVGSYLSGTITVLSGTPFTISAPVGDPYVSCDPQKTSCTYTNIPSSGFGLVNVTFTPMVIGSNQSTQITFLSPYVVPVGHQNISKTVIGNGVYLVSGPVGGTNFGNVVVGHWKELTLRVTNSGSIDLGSDNLSFPFPVYTCVAGCPFNLPPGASVNTTIRFTPTAVATYNGNAFLTAHPSVTFPFTGAGVVPSFKFKDQ